jgi:hypothetical protein
MQEGGLPRTHFVCTRPLFACGLRIGTAGAHTETHTTPLSRSVCGRIPPSTLAQACSAARRTCLLLAPIPLHRPNGLLGIRYQAEPFGPRENTHTTHLEPAISVQVPPSPRPQIGLFPNPKHESGQRAAGSGLGPALQQWARRCRTCLAHRPRRRRRRRRQGRRPTLLVL